MTSAPDKTQPGISSTDTAGNSSAQFLRSLLKISRSCIITSAVLFILMIFASDIDGMITGSLDFTYAFGCGLVNYSAGFIRRGLLGEILQSMNLLCQPFLAVTLLASASLIFIFCVILSRLIRLNAALPYILAIIFSPSLIFMQRGARIIQDDALLIALNLAASCLLLRLIAHRKQPSLHKPSFAGMLSIDFVIVTLLTVSALIHELSASLLPPVMLLFFIYARKVRRTMHAAAASVLLITVYAALMTSFKYADPDTIAESWSGIYGDPDSFRYNTALLNTADKAHALNCVRMTLTLLRESGPAYIPQLLLAVAVPFAILLLSGITIFHSASSRARRARTLLAVLCTCPLGLCLVGYDFGRWFSVCAINLTAYCLLIAHPAGRPGPGEILSEKDRIAKNLIKQCAVTVVAVALLYFRLDFNGYFYETEQPLSEEAKEAAINSSNLLRDIKPLVTGEIVLHPGNGARRHD